MAKRIPFLAMMMLGPCLLLVAATPADTRNAPKLRTEQDVQNLCENALSLIVDGDVQDAIAALRQYATSILKEDVDSLENHLIGQAATIKDSYGDAIGYVQISKEDLKDTIFKTVYVVKYQRHLIRWSFIFYKPYDSWVLDYFNYDDAIEDLFAPRLPAPAR